ncbi:MAG TPA: helix-turn-helix transcriptional regulator [Firmicutes bacterium]|nr:helix-turn-helix transcriptional regulator [Bacillota bacterium]
MALGERIRQLRKARGMPARVLAEQVGVHIRHIYAIERGRYTPSLGTLMKIAQVLDIPAAELWLDEGEAQDTILYEYVKRLPPEVQRFLTQERAASYLMATRELASAGLSPEDIKEIGTAITRLLGRHSS